MHKWSNLVTIGAQAGIFDPFKMNLLQQISQKYMDPGTNFSAKFRAVAIELEQAPHW